MGVTCEIKDYKELKKQLEKMKKAPETVMKRTMTDVKTRVPKWISAEISKVYGIKKAEIGDGKTSTVKVVGDNLTSTKIIYKGRVLTPTHFSMSPTIPKEGGGSYTLKASITKGQRSTLGKVKKMTKKQREALGKNFTRSGTRSSDHSPIMLMHTGNKQEGGTNYIPFQRKSTNRQDIKSIKTLSVPQMASSERVAPNITKAINEGLEKRLAQHMKLLEK